MALGIKDFFHVIRTIDRLLAVEKKHADLIEKLSEEIRSIESRVVKLEARESILIVEAKAAASTAASTAAVGHLSDLARRIGVLEERTRVTREQKGHSALDGDTENTELEANTPLSLVHKGQ